MQSFVISLRTGQRKSHQKKGGADRPRSSEAMGWVLCTDTQLCPFYQTRVSAVTPYGGGKLPQSTINGCFFYKASHAQELMEDKTTQPIRVEVVKVIQLTAQQFHHFSDKNYREIGLTYPTCQT